MKTNLVYQDEKSHKFWKIELKGLSFTTTYGKVGTVGRTASKEFESTEKAKKAAKKLVQQKLKKGYTEEGIGDQNPTPQFLTAKDAANDSRLKSGEIIYGMTFFDRCNEWVLLMEGDVHFTEDLYGNWIEKAITQNGNKQIKKTGVVVMVLGNLVVDGLVDHHLYVSGDLICDVYENMWESTVWVEGNVEIKHLMEVRYDGLTSFGSLKVPFILRDAEHTHDYPDGDAITIQLRTQASWDTHEVIEASDFEEHLLEALYVIDGEKFVLKDGELKKHVINGESPFKRTSKYHPSNSEYAVE